MKKLNILIIDHGSRSGQIGLPYHYSKLGHNVYMMKPGCADFDWDKIPTWPRMLMKSSPNNNKRNFEIDTLPSFDDFEYGEDRFLVSQNKELRSKLYDEDIHCTLISEEDLLNGKVKIDAVHTTDHCAHPPVLKSRLSWIRKHVPHAKWISSSFDPGALKPLGITPPNVCRFLPAIYRHIYRDVNSCNFYRHRFEFDLLGVDYSSERKRSDFGSFNHNFAVRDPNCYKWFSQVVDAVKEEGINLQNYGANVRAHGADLKYDSESGVTGKLKTLSPRDAAKKYTTLRAVVHFKFDDWAGGVPAYSRFSRTPMIIFNQWIRNTCAQDVWIPGFNCIAIDNLNEAVQAIVELNKNDELVKILSEGVKETDQRLFHQGYWDQFDAMLQNLQ